MSCLTGKKTSCWMDEGKQAFFTPLQPSGPRLLQQLDYLETMCP